MLMQTAETLGITKDEVQELLTGLDMSETDLLNPEGLKAVVLAAAGETDACSFMTNEELMADLKELQGSLAEITAQVSEMTGLDVTEVETLFESAGMQEVQTALSEAVAAAPEISVDAEAEPESSEESSEVHTEQTLVMSSSAEEDGAEMMLESSLAGSEAG